MQVLRVTYEKRSEVTDCRQTVKAVDDVVRVTRPILEREVVEVCLVICLNSDLTLIGCHELSRGTLDATLVQPRAVYQVAFLANAKSVILVHNHPSGDPTPSSDDFAVTARIKQAGQLIGIELLDHVIIGRDGRFVSLSELGRL